MSQNQTTSSDKKEKLKGMFGNRRTMLLSGVVALVLLLAAGIPLYIHAISYESTDDAFIEAHVTSISPRLAGHVAGVYVNDNQQVKEGQLLAELDSRDYQVALDVALAQLEQTKAAVVEAQSQVAAAQNILQQKQADLTSQHAGLAQVEAEVAEVKAGHDRDRSDLARIKRIAKAGAVSRQEYDHARATEAITRAKLNSAKRLVDTHSAKIRQAVAAGHAAEDELRQAQAQVDARVAEQHKAEAEVERARLNLSYTRIKAPCDGFITKKSVEKGAYLQVGQKLFSIVSRDNWVVANFKETQVTDMRPGQPVEVEVDTYPDVVFKGHVDSIQRGTGSRFSLLPPENATGNFIKVVQRIPVKIVLDDPGQLKRYALAPGMSVIPNVDISNVPAIPVRAERTTAALLRRGR